MYSHVCPSVYWLLLTKSYSCVRQGACVRNCEDADDLRVVLTQRCLSILSSIHPSMLAAILSSVKSNVNLCFPFMFTSKMDGRTHTLRHILINTHAQTHSLTLSHLPLMSCYPACWELAPCSLNPVRQPITGQWGGRWPHRPAQHSPATTSIDSHLRIRAAVGWEVHGGQNIRGSQRTLERHREETHMKEGTHAVFHEFMS